MSNPYALDEPLRRPRQICPICPSQTTTPCFKPGHLAWCDYCGYEYSPLTSQQCPGCRTLGVRMTHGQMMRFIDDTTNFVNRATVTTDGPRPQRPSVQTPNPLAGLSLDSTNPRIGKSMGGPASGQSLEAPASQAFSNPSYPNAFRPTTIAGTTPCINPALLSLHGASTYRSPNIKRDTSAGSQPATPARPSVAPSSASTTCNTGTNTPSTVSGNPPRVNSRFIPTSGATNFHTIGDNLLAGGGNQGMLMQNTTRPRVPLEPPSMSRTGVGSRSPTLGGGTSMRNANATPSLPPAGSNSTVASGVNFRNFGHDNPPLRRSTGGGRGGNASTRDGRGSG